MSAPQLMQAKLSFSTSRRNASSSSKSKSTTPALPPVPQTSAVHHGLPDDDSDVELVSPPLVSSKTKKTSVAAISRKRKRAHTDESTLVQELSLDDAAVTVEDKAAAREREGRWRKHYSWVCQQRDYLPPIHGKDSTMVDQILHMFDLTYDYGPCVGLTRLERWDQARSLGKQPPAEVKEILMTEPYKSHDRYTQCVFYDSEM